ncbi:hypothetical protein DY000_02025716 [Brassica cretica]|uniref:Uncharacterized protein n=1 Tax=Brassica cretica TaxID=69181 RepID=A0ABQ7EII8_BRACR|nr:hypothetical protein DY000_02025716 [Brassica cretica]
MCRRFTFGTPIRDQTPNRPIPIRRVSPQLATVPARVPAHSSSRPFEVLLVVRVLQSANKRCSGSDNYILRFLKETPSRAPLNQLTMEDPGGLRELEIRAINGGNRRRCKFA